jgi:hypothetical protein
MSVKNHLGRISSKVRMNMRDTTIRKPGQQLTGFGQSDNVQYCRSITSSGETQRHPQSGSETSRVANRDTQGCGEKSKHSTFKHVPCPRPLPKVLWVNDGTIIPAAQGYAHDLEALAFQSSYLSANESVADLGVLVDEVRYCVLAHEIPAVFGVIRRRRIAAGTVPDLDRRAFVLIGRDHRHTALPFNIAANGICIVSTVGRARSRP